MASPNHHARPDVRDISLLIIHCISLPPGEFGGGYIDRMFCNKLRAEDHPALAALCGLRVSSHVLISRDGRARQYVPFDRAAWHAGTSRFEGRSACNDFSIGVELEGAETVPFTDAQYECLVALSRCLLREYPALTPERIVGHADVAPGRKSDPGATFDWDRYRAALSVAA